MFQNSSMTNQCTRLDPYSDCWLSSRKSQQKDQEHQQEYQEYQSFGSIRVF